MLGKNNKMLVMSLALFLCAISGIAHYKNQSNKSVGVSNPFFFEHGKTSVKYEGYFVPISGNEIRQDAILNIYLLQKFEDGALFALKLSQLDVSDPYDNISLGHEHLGYFYVTKDIIYRGSLSYFDPTILDYNEFVLSEDKRVVNAIEQNKEDFLNNCDIVCAENGTTDILLDGEWHEFVEVNGDERIYKCYSDYIGGTRLYENIVWEKGKGIIHYKRGAGSMLRHVEFGKYLP